MNVDLNAFVREPAKVQALPADEARALLPQLVSLVLSLTVQAAQEAPVGAKLGEFMNAAQVEATFGLSPTWLAEHRRELETAGIVHRVSHKVVVYRAAGLRTWVQARRLAPGA
jgi:hypothetical protein